MAQVTLVYFCTGKSVAQVTVVYFCTGKLVAQVTVVYFCTGKSVAQVALRWLLQKDVVSSVIIGARTLEQLDDNMGAANGWTLTEEEVVIVMKLLWEEGNVLFKDALNTFYLRLYVVGYMVKRPLGQLERNPACATAWATLSD